MYFSTNEIEADKDGLARLVSLKVRLKKKNIKSAGDCVPSFYDMYTIDYTNYSPDSDLWKGEVL